MATPAYTIDVKRNYEDTLANSQAYADSVQQIKDYFTLGTQKAQQDYNYDISEAYANYKRQQLATMSMQNVGIGDREYATGQLQKNYQNTAQDISNAYQTQLEAVATNYIKQANDLNENISNDAKQMANLYDYIIQYGYDNNTSFGLSGTYDTRNEDLYLRQDDGSRVLTEEAQDYLNTMLYGDDINVKTGFLNYLKEENSSLYDYAVDNWQKFAATTSGRDVTDLYRYTNEEKSAARQRIMHQQNKNYISQANASELSKTGKITLGDKTYKEASKKELQPEQVPKHVESGDVFSDVHAVANKDGSFYFTDNVKMIVKEGDKYYEYTLSNDSTPKRANNVGNIPENTNPAGLSAGSLSQTDASVYNWSNAKNPLEIDGKKYITSTYGGVSGSALSDNEKTLLKNGTYKYGDTKRGANGELYCLLARQTDAMSHYYEPVWAKLKEVQ